MVAAGDLRLAVTAPFEYLSPPWPPWGLMAAYLVAGVVVGAIAALAPAARSARTNVLTAIAYE